MSWLSYGWTVFLNLVALFVVFAIYNVIYGSFETIVVSMLVLVYVSLTSFSAGFGQVKMQEMLMIQGEFKRLRKLLNENQTEYDLEAEREEAENAKALTKKVQIKFFINAGFNFVIFIVAILNLLGSL